MGDSDDLSERLRVTAHYGPGKGWKAVEAEAAEAANYIDQLEARIAQLAGATAPRMCTSCGHVEDDHRGGPCLGSIGCGCGGFEMQQPAP